jgi:hypothetical protein
LADLKYGAIVVPVGQEMLLFGEKPDNDSTRRVLDAVDEAKRTVHRPNGMHEPDKDSDEFRRERFALREERTATSINDWSDRDALSPGRATQNVRNPDPIETDDVMMTEAPIHVVNGTPDATTNSQGRKRLPKGKQVSRPSKSVSGMDVSCKLNSKDKNRSVFKRETKEEPVHSSSGYIGQPVRVVSKVKRSKPQGVSKKRKAKSKKAGP